jgi:hypothetical protein
MSRSLKSAANEGDTNKIGSVAKDVGLGSALTLGPMSVRGAVTASKFTLPDNAKASNVVRCFATAGTVTGALTPIISGVVATGQCAIDVLGNVVFFGADAVTAAEILYEPLEGDVITTSTVTDATGLALLGGSGQGRLLLAATIAGASRVVLARAAVPTATDAALTLLGTGIKFNVADAAKACVLTFVEFPANTVISRMNAQVNY